MRACGKVQERSVVGQSPARPESLHAQGKLDLAFEKFRNCLVDDAALLGQIYNLGLDYERKRQFNKAANRVQIHSTSTTPSINDVRQRI